MKEKHLGFTIHTLQHGRGGALGAGEGESRPRGSWAPSPMVWFRTVGFNCHISKNLKLVVHLRCPNILRRDGNSRDVWLIR